MPPVMETIKDDCKIFSKDPAIKGFSRYTHIFTDVTFGLENEKRMVVIRTPEGTLQEAPFAIKKRSWNIYFPTEGRSLRDPAMFEADNIKRLLKEEEYGFILDRACLQFEPYEQKYHDITSQVYLHVNNVGHFEALRSTRHFGPMAFAFAWHKMIDDMLLDMIRNDYLKDAVQLICLYYEINSVDESREIIKSLKTEEETEQQILKTIKNVLSKESESEKIEKDKEDLELDELCFGFIQNYVSKYSPKKPQLQLALQTYKEWHNELKSIASAVQ